MKRRFFDEAREESHLSDYDGQHLGAVAVYGDKFVLAKAHNTNRTNTTQWRYNRYRVNQRSNIMEKPARAHAEINLCRKIKYLDIDFSRVVVYIYRELRDGTLALAAPCAACERAIELAERQLEPDIAKCFDEIIWESDYEPCTKYIINAEWKEN